MVNIYNSEILDLHAQKAHVNDMERYMSFCSDACLFFFEKSPPSEMHGNLRENPKNMHLHPEIHANFHASLFEKQAPGGNPESRCH